LLSLTWGGGRRSSFSCVRMCSYCRIVSHFLRYKSRSISYASELEIAFYREVFLLCWPLPRRPLAARRILILPTNQHAWRPITFGMKGSSYHCSQITGGVENAVLHVDIPRTGGRDSDLLFEAVLQEYLQFPYEFIFQYFLGVCSSLTSISSNFSANTRRLCFCFLSVKSPVVLSLFTKLWIICLLGSLSSQNLRRHFRRHILADPYFT
jgi:hypothetical protein